VRAFGLNGPLLYLRSQQVQLAVIALLACYPAIFHLLATSPVSNEARTLLPEMNTMVAILYFSLFAMSFDFVSGYTGYLSFGHAAFYGTGAYFVILAAGDKIPFVPADTHFMVLLLLGALLAAGIAALIGLVSFRLTGVYFAMITLGFAQVMYVFVRGWDYIGSNPRDGPSAPFTQTFEIGVPYVDQLDLAIGRLLGESVTLAGHSLTSETVSFYLVGAVVAICFFAMQRIIHSPFGRVMVAIRENEERAEAVGYDTFRYKLGAFVMSAFFGGVAGALFAGFRRAATPEETFYFLVTGEALLVSIIGGFGTLAGALYGRLFDVTIQEFLSKEAGFGLLPWLQDNLSESELETELLLNVTLEEFIDVALNGHAALYVGIVFVLFVLYVPNGIVGTVRAFLGGPVSRRLPEKLWGDE